MPDDRITQNRFYWKGTIAIAAVWGACLGYVGSLYVSSPVTRIVDLNDDGRPDAVISYRNGMESHICIQHADKCVPLPEWIELMKKENRPSLEQEVKKILDRAK
jgi:hypothetical protein